MKKLLILSAFVLTGVIAANAQTPVTDNKTTEVNVSVSDIRTIAITGTPTLALTNTADYTAVAGTTGKPFAAATNVTVVSRNGYMVKADLSGALHNSTLTPNGLVDIPGTALGIRVANIANAGTSNPVEINSNTSFGPAASSIPDIIKTESTGNSGGTLGTTFDVMYTLGNFPNIINVSTGNFVANVTYTIESN